MNTNKQVYSNKNPASSRAHATCHAQPSYPGSTWLGLGAMVWEEWGEDTVPGACRPCCELCVTCVPFLPPTERVEEEGPSASGVRSQTGSRGSEKGGPPQGQGAPREGGLLRLHPEIPARAQ